MDNLEVLEDISGELDRLNDNLEVLENISGELDRLNYNLEVLIEVQQQLLKQVTKLNYVPYKP